MIFWSEIGYHRSLIETVGMSLKAFERHSMPVKRALILVSDLNVGSRFNIAWSEKLIETLLRAHYTPPLPGVHGKIVRV